MGLHYDDGSFERVNIGEQVSIRFLDAVAWTFFSFNRFDSFTDERTIIAKEAGASTKQFHLKAETDGSLEMRFTGGAGFNTGASNVMSTGTWYMCAATNDGAATATSCDLYIFEMDGTLLESANGEHGGDSSDLTADVKTGTRRTTSDENDGDQAYVCYIDGSALSEDELWNCVFQPYATAMLYDSRFFLPLLDIDPEPDWSGNGNTGAHENSPTIADNPPVGPISPAYIIAGAAAAAPATRRIFAVT